MKKQKNHPIDLEIICHKAKQPGAKPPVLFVHGAFVGAWCWEEYFLNYFSENGHDAYAVSLRGHGKSGGFYQAPWANLKDYVDDLHYAVTTIGCNPVIVGHSLGGMVLQKYLEQHQCLSAILLATIPHNGLLTSNLKKALQNPVQYYFEQTALMTDFYFNLFPATQKRLFHQDIPPKQLEQYLLRMRPSPASLFYDLTWGDIPRQHNPQKVPMIVLGAEDDALFNLDSQRTTAEAHGAEFDLLPNMSHTMMLDPNWKKAADRMLAWIAD